MCGKMYFGFAFLGDNVLLKFFSFLRDFYVKW